MIHQTFLGVFINNYSNFILWVNLVDQLRLVSVTRGQDLKYSLLRLQKAVARIEEALKVESHKTQGRNNIQRVVPLVRIYLLLPHVVRSVQLTFDLITTDGFLRKVLPTKRLHNIQWRLLPLSPRRVWNWL